MKPSTSSANTSLTLVFDRHFTVCRVLFLLYLTKRPKRFQDLSKSPTKLIPTGVYGTNLFAFFPKSDTMKHLWQADCLSIVQLLKRGNGI